MKKAIRVLSLTLVFLIVIGMMPFVPFVSVREAEAAGTITTEDVTKKINEIWKQIGNDKKQYYWNKSQFGNLFLILLLLFLNYLIRFLLFCFHYII